MDGGVRRGTDVFKALALGASGVFVSIRKINELGFPTIVIAHTCAHYILINLSHWFDIKQLKLSIY